MAGHPERHALIDAVDRKHPDSAAYALEEVEKQAPEWIADNLVDLVDLMGWMHPITGFEDVTQRLATTAARVDLDRAAQLVPEQLGARWPDEHLAVARRLLLDVVYIPEAESPLVELFARAAGAWHERWPFLAWFVPEGVDPYTIRRAATRVEQAVAWLQELAASGRPAEAAEGVAVLLECLPAAVREGTRTDSLQLAIRARMAPLMTLVGSAGLPDPDQDVLTDRVLAALDANPDLFGSVGLAVGELAPTPRAAERLVDRLLPSRAPAGPPGRDEDRIGAWVTVCLTAGRHDEVLAQRPRIEAKVTRWPILQLVAAALAASGDVDAALAMTEGRPLARTFRAELLASTGDVRAALRTRPDPLWVTPEALEEVAERTGLALEEVYQLRAEHPPPSHIRDTLVETGLALGMATEALQVATRRGDDRPVRAALDGAPPELERELRIWLVHHEVQRSVRDRQRLEYRREMEGLARKIGTQAKRAVGLGGDLDWLQEALAAARGPVRDALTELQGAAPAPTDGLGDLLDTMFDDD